MVFALTWLPAVLEAAGLKVAEQPGWRTRGRAEMGTVRGVMCHHTGTRGGGVMPTLRTITEGRAAGPGVEALPGPLAQLGLGRDGTWFVVAAGRANHAGGGRWQGVDTGNSSFIGVEAENAGTGDEPWPEVQMDAYRRGVAALLSHIGASSIMCCGHKEYALPKGRKVDPSFDMDVFRSGVAAVMAGSAPAPALIPAADAHGRPTMRRGATGDLVKSLQSALGVDPVGTFGPQTEAAVRAFQRGHGLTPDGIVGPQTWAAVLPPTP